MELRSRKEETAGPLEGNREASNYSRLHSHIKIGTAWIVTILFGVIALVCSAKNLTSRELTLGVMAALLLIYSVYGHTIKDKNTLKFADSIYFMGFLWTLFALISTFIFWEGPKLTGHAVLVAFGYALVTTFCGMLLRLLFIQFQETLPDRLLDAQDTIDRRVAALTKQIEEATNEISSFRGRASTELGSTLQELVLSLSSIRETIDHQQQKVTGVVVNNLESAIKNILKRLEEIKLPHEILNAEATKFSAKLGKRGEELDKRLSESADKVKSFAESLLQSDGAKGVGTALSKLVGQIEEGTEQFSGMTAAVKKNREEIESNHDTLRSLKLGFEMVLAQMSAFEAELKRLSSASQSAELGNGMNNVHKSVQSTLDSSRKIESTMSEVLTFWKKRVNEERSVDRA